MASPLPARLFSAQRPGPGAPFEPAPPDATPDCTASDCAIPDSAISEPDARSEDRQPVSAGAMLVANQSDLQPVTIADLSRHGCCLEGDCADLRPGQFISIKIGKLDRLPALVRWVDEGRAGVEFTRALLPEVLEYHMRELSPE